MSYPVKTLLRYYPSTTLQAGEEEHYTAVVTKNGIFQVKPSKKSFSTLEEWLTSLPNQPTQDSLKVAVKQTPLTWKLQYRDRFRDYWYQTWTEYLFKAIVRTDIKLKQDAALCQAFNHLSDVLESYKDTFVIRLSRTIKKYEHIMFREPSKFVEQKEWELLPVSFLRLDNMGCFDSVESRKDFSPQVYEAYKVLYDLMEQRGVIEQAKRTMLYHELKRLRKTNHYSEKVLQRLVIEKKKAQSKEFYQRLQLQKLTEKIARLEAQLSKKQKIETSETVLRHEMEMREKRIQECEDILYGQ